MAVADAARADLPYLHGIGNEPTAKKETEMFVDMRLADLEVERRRERLARDYARANRRRREQPKLQLPDEGTWHAMLLARFMLLNR